jgi:RimJ/RimL family protein N-acetyltransferase
MEIRPATSDDYEVIWSIIGPTIQAGETYALPCDMAKEEALAYWIGPDRKTFVAVEGGEVIGTYYLRPNQLGGGQHVANCGYMTAAHATGRGVARRMCEHSLEFAKSSGFRAMQFNLVISTNERALQLWERLGFSQVGRLPLAFNSPTQGLVDAIVMYRNL